MSTVPTTEYWAGPGFAEELRAFVAAAVGEPVSLEQLRLRPWSTVWRVATADGVFYAKDNCPGQRHEAATMTRLAALDPEHVVPVAAADVERGLLLTPDQGPTVRASRPAPDVDLWCRVVVAAAELQRAVAPHLHRLPLTVLDPADAVTLVRGYLRELGGYPVGDPRRLPDADRRGVEAMLPDVARWSEQVQALGLPLTLVHNDLHTDNVFAARGDGRIRFFDFGDAVAASPLESLRIPLNVVEHDLACDPGDVRLGRIADAALEVWSDLASMAELRAALPAALQLARLARVESWRRCLVGMSGAELAEHGGSPAGWLATLAVAPTPAPIWARPAG